MIAVIDYGMGNTGSVTNAVNCLGYKSILTNKVNIIMNAEAVILPGVGAAGEAVKKIVELGMDNIIRYLINERRPLLAICVGLQVLLSRTEEDGGYKCLDIIEGDVKKLPAGFKIPHIGWNQLEQKIDNPIFTDIPDKSNFYFVHSYYADPVDKSIIAGTTEYSLPFCSMIMRDSLVATQFHPEKSGAIGLRLYSNFINIALGRAIP